ncbi:MAG: transaldolase [Chitinivibrionales bacterium]|nr:transaldolase [Chitinivibrionales bacterium]MBD3356557.1 transaldolase [Chitinivibrionales bacterium]
MQYSMQHFNDVIAGTRIASFHVSIWQIGRRNRQKRQEAKMERPTETTIIPTDSNTKQLAASLATEGIEPPPNPPAFSSSPFWAGLKATGSELWLDTGDIEAAQELWTREFSAITVNNTLLNTEIQKGTYDDIIRKAGKKLSYLEPQARVMEIAFILNARHGLKLAYRFGASVSVELHTSLADDIEGTIEYAQRFHELCPNHFYVKIPLTPAGLIAGRRLAERAIPINLTLGFSARHNYIATAFAGPSYVNVFLGRLNAFIAGARLGNGELVGERSTLASQKAVNEAREIRGTTTRQIAASLRNPPQVAALAGIDVHTMPVKVARAAPEDLDGWWESCLDKEYTVELHPEIEPAEIRIEKLWDLSKQIRDFTQSIINGIPSTSEEFRERAHAGGLADLFPSLSDQERQWIRQDGKVPGHDKWATRIERGDLAIDSLLNAAGLAAFHVDQQALDQRIEAVMEK